MTKFHTIQFETTLHIIPSDEPDLHALTIPCPCHPTILPGDTIQGFHTIALHAPWGDLPCKFASCMNLIADDA